MRKSSIIIRPGSDSSEVFRRVLRVSACLVADSQLCGSLIADEFSDARDQLVSKGCSYRTDGKGDIVRLSATGSAKTLTDADMKVIANFRGLKYLNLHQHDITDRGFASLLLIDDLEELFANMTLTTDESTRHIARWTNLRTLCLPDAVTDAGLKHLEGLQTIERIVAGSPRITDESIDSVLKFQRLRFVAQGPGVTPAGYERLAALPNIENVQTFEWMDVSFMPPLAKFPKLNHLNLHTTHVTEEGLSYLRRLENLRRLTLPKDVTDSGIASISHMRKLQFLNLRTTRVSNDGLTALKDIKSLSLLTLPPTTSDEAVSRIVAYDLRLSSLNVIGGGYTDACIPSLLALKQLNNLGLWRTKISDEGVQRLQRALPHVRIDRK